jgi:hypothetical protein
MGSRGEHGRGSHRPSAHAHPRAHTHGITSPAMEASLQHMRVAGARARAAAAHAQAASGRMLQGGMNGTTSACDSDAAHASRLHGEPHVDTICPAPTHNKRLRGAEPRCGKGRGGPAPRLLAGGGEKAWCDLHRKRALGGRRTAHAAAATGTAVPHPTTLTNPKCASISESAAAHRRADVTQVGTAPTARACAPAHTHLFPMGMSSPQRRLATATLQRVCRGHAVRPAARTPFDTHAVTPAHAPAPRRLRPTTAQARFPRGRALVVPLVGQV